MWFGHSIYRSDCRSAWCLKVHFGERFRKAFKLSGLTSGFLSAALEAPAGLLVDTFRALISGHRKTECPGTNSASALSPGDPGYM